MTKSPEPDDDELIDALANLDDLDAQLLLRLRLVEAFHSGCMAALNRISRKPDERIGDAVDRIAAMTTDQLMEKHGVRRSSTLQ